MIYITDVHMSTGGTRHEHIANVKWNNPETKSGENTRQEIVDWIETGGVAKVKSGTKEVTVAVVNASPKYLRTNADGVWTDNLLAMPLY